MYYKRIQRCHRTESKRLLQKKRRNANDPQELQDKVIDEARKEGIPEKEIETFQGRD